MPSLVYVLTASNLAREQAPQWGNNTREKWASEENEWGFHLSFLRYFLSSQATSNYSRKLGRVRKSVLQFCSTSFHASIRLWKQVRDFLNEEALSTRFTHKKMLSPLNGCQLLDLPSAGGMLYYRTIMKLS